MKGIVSADTQRKLADFGVGLSGREPMRNPPQKGKQMMAVATLAGAPFTDASGEDNIVISCSQRW
jgi:hypothetical protein